MNEQRRAGRWRRIGIVVLGLAAGIAALTLVLHTPFVRAAVLRYALAAVQDRYALRIEAARLDYNLVALRVGLADVRVSAPTTAEQPFFEAAYLSVTFPSRVLFGALAFQDVSVTNARVYVIRRRDGTINLPRASETPTGDPPPLDIRGLDLPRLAVEIRDEPRDFNLRIPAVDIELTPDNGRIVLAEPADVRVADRATQISQLDGEAAFGGRALRLTNMQLRADEASLRVNGSLLLIARVPVFDLRVDGTGDIGRLARWGIADGDVPEGDLAFDGRLTGPMGDPQADVQVSTPRLSWQGVAVTDVTARARITSAVADVDQLELGLEGGRVIAAGVVPFDSGAPGRVTASWSRVNAASLVRALAPDSNVIPAGAVSGQLHAEGPLSEVKRWSADARARMEPAPNARGRISVAGDSRFQLSEGRWRLEGRHLIGGVAPMTVAVRGEVGDAPDRASVQGGVQLGGTDLPEWLNVVRTANLAALPQNAVTSGALEADVQLAGSLTDPQIDGRVRLRHVAGSHLRADTIDATVAGRPLQRRIEFTIGAGNFAIAGQPLHDLRSAGRVTDTTLVIDELFAAQPSGSGLLTGTGTYNLSTTQYTASFETTQWLLTPSADQPVAGRVNVRFSGAGTTAAPSGRGQITVRDAMWQGVALGDLEAAVQLDGGVADIDARAPEFRTTMTARVQLEAPYVATVDASADEVDLARVLRDVETPTRVEGTMTVTARAEGRVAVRPDEPVLAGRSAFADRPVESWRLGSASLDVASLDVKAGELPIRLVEAARFRYASERVHVDRLEATVGDTRLFASGELPAFDPAPETPGLLLDVTGDVDEVARAAAATGLTHVPIAGGEGPVALLARVIGSLQTPVVAADLEVGPGSVTLQDRPPISMLRLKAHAESGWLELREAAASYQGANLSATGKAPLSLVTGRADAGPGRELVLQARATNLTPAVLEGFVDATTLEQVAGSVDATVDVTSPTLDLADLAGELRLERFEMRIADLPVTQRAPTRIVARDGFARIAAWDWIGQGSTLEVRGQVRLSDRQAAILANGEVDLRLLTPFVRNAGLSTAGRFVPRLSITGALDNPRLDGDITIADGELRRVDPRILVSGLTARAVLSRSSAQIASLTGTVNGGSLTGGGVIEYRPEGQIDAQLSADIRGMALEFPQGLRSELSAALTLTMARAGADLSASARSASADAPKPGEGRQVGPSGRLSGTVTVVRGAYRQPLAVVTGLLTTMRTRRLSASVEPSPLLQALALDIRLLTDEDISVDNNYARVQLGGDLRVIGTAAAPVLSGRAELREGGQLFVGRNVYTMNAGTIDFANPVVIEPDLNVETATRAGGEDIEVTITGTPETISVDLRSTSDPDLGQAEIASLLLTGRRFEDLAPGDAAFVGTQVLGNFSAEVLGFASRAVGLDTLRLGGVENAARRRDPTAVATELDPTTRLTFGKSLGADVDVTFSQSLRDSDAQTWIVEYLPARRLELRLVSDDDDLRSYGFRHDMTFGTAAPGTIATGNESRRQQAAPVSAVSVAGELVFPEERVREQLRLRVGDRFDFGAWQDDRARLERFYHREGYLTARVGATRSDPPSLVELRRGRAGAVRDGGPPSQHWLAGSRSDPTLADSQGGIALAYQVTAGPQTRISGTGLELDASLQSRLETAWSQSVFDDFLIEEATDIIRDTLARDGYLQPAVSARVLTEASVKTLTITVERGARSSGTTVRVEGADEALTRQIDMWLEMRGLLDRATADPGALEREVTAYLRSGGYLRARVTAGAPLFQDPVAIVPLRVDAGPIFRIVSIAFEGAEGLDVETLRETAALGAGMPYDPAAADAARDRLVALYRREGFPSPTVTVRQRVGAEVPAVDLTFAIDEGARQVLAEVVVSGNRAIDSDVIVRALGLPLSAPLRAEGSLQARTRVFDTGLFRRVDVSAEPVGPVEGGARVLPMRMTVTVEEWPALRLRYGFRVAEERPEGELEGRDLVPGLSADLTRRTLFGRAITTGGAVELQRREQRARLFANAPTLLGRPIESSLIAERSREEFTTVTLVTERSGISWEQRTRVAGNLSLSYAYRFERNHTFDTEASMNPDFPAFDITVNIGRLSGSAAWDTRDDPADTRRGLLVSSSFEFAPEAAGSDIRFVRQLAQAYSFRQWRNVVLASAGRVGVVRPFSGQELIPSVRFFAGGARTVRGVPEDSLGARDFFGDPVGGQALVVLNQEVRVPIYRWLRGVGFVDAGNVFARLRDAGLSNLVRTVGFGLRLATPFALLRADFARPVWAGTRERGGRWSFGIGHAF